MAEKLCVLCPHNRFKYSLKNQKQNLSTFQNLQDTTFQFKAFPKKSPGPKRTFQLFSRQHLQVKIPPLKHHRHGDMLPDMLSWELECQSTTIHFFQYLLQSYTSAQFNYEASHLTGKISSIHSSSIHFLYLLNASVGSQGSLGENPLNYIAF